MLYGVHPEIGFAAVPQVKTPVTESLKESPTALDRWFRSTKLYNLES